ncbi:MAG: ABC transporter permease, partial [Chrysiogenales bacterium]
MIKNYLKIAWRNIVRHKGYSFINIFGLAVGMACCVLMMLWIQNESSFDRFHANGNSLCRVIAETRTENDTFMEAKVATPLGPALKEAFPEIIDFSRYLGGLKYGIQYDGRNFDDDVIAAAEPSFFTMFSFPFIQGDPKTALVEPHSIVITEGLARKIFGNGDPMSKTLSFFGGREVFSVTGVIRNIPQNSHLRFDCVIPCVNMQRYHHVDYGDWSEKFLCLYVRLAPGASAAKTSSKISRFFSEKLSRPNASLMLQPLKDVHLRSNFRLDFYNDSQVSITTLWIFSLAALAILLLACINFMNLATAQAASRGKEVGLRKVTGARRSELIRQFLGEAVAISFLSLGLALLLAYAFLPLFNSLAERQLTLARLAEPWLLFGLLAITLLTGLLAGSYPALILSAFRPAQILKGGPVSGGRGQAALRKSLVVIQFAMTLFLVVGTFIVGEQLKFMRSKDLGINPHHVLTFYLPAREDVLKNALLANPRVLSMTHSLPPGIEQRGIDNLTWEGKNPDDRIAFYPTTVDPDYLRTFGIKMAAGRFFSHDLLSDRSRSVVINETAAGLLGPGSPIGKRITIGAQTTPWTIPERKLTVIGVIRDFHQMSLHRPIEPALFTWEKEGGWPYISLRISPVNVAATLKFLERTSKKLAPAGFRFTYEFLDMQLDAFYKSERTIKSILELFTILAMITACLGLFGLALFLAEKRTKEIGIRKVLGASVSEITFLLSLEFVKWVAIAALVAWPLAYYA